MKFTDFIIEIMYVSIIVIYILFFLYGRWRNETMAESWVRSFSDIFEYNFAKLGSETILMKDGQHVFIMKGSGRQNSIGVQAVLELCKRHDILYTMYQTFRNTKDKVTIDLVLENMDPFVFALISNNHVKGYKDNYKDIQRFTKPRDFSSMENFPDDKFTVLAECEEILPVIMSHKVVEILDTYYDSIEAIHFSDQFQNKKYKQLIRFVYYLPLKADEAEQHKVLLNMAMYFIDLVSSIQLSPETKKKALERRAKAKSEQEKEKAEEKMENMRKKQEEKKKKEDERIKKMTPEQQAKEEAKLRRRETRKASKIKVVFG